LSGLSEKSFGYKTIDGPSFKDEVPNADAWRKFLASVDHDKAKQFAELWYKKASDQQGVPTRSSLSFEELVPFGPNIYMAKRNDKNIWDTTYCGSAIVSSVGFDASSKSINDFATDETLDFWTMNLNKMLIEHHVFWEFYILGFANKDHVYCTSITFPLSSAGGGEPDVQLVYEIYTDDSLFPDRLS
jgi:hypothetical protein